MLLGNIARKGDPEDVIKLIELVFLVIVNCHKKESFIRKIMMLEEKYQFALMLFIKKILNQEEDEGQVEAEIQSKEIEILKNAKKNLMAQIADQQRELGSVTNLKDMFLKENEELKLINAQLQNELDNVATKLSNNAPDLITKLEKKLNEKTQMLEMSKQVIESARRDYQTEISKLKDELDIALADKHKLGYYETCIEKYKKKIENLSGLKKKNQELKKSNEQMQQLIKKHQYDSEYHTRAKAKIKQLKLDLQKEKGMVDMLNINIDCKEKQIKQFQNNIIELRDKMRFLENYIEELKQGSNNSSASEESNPSHPTENDIEYSRKKVMHMNSCSSRSDNAENLLRENNRLHYIVDSTYQKKKQLKESLNMLYEEMLTREFTNTYKIFQLVQDNEAMAAEIETYSEERLEIESEKHVFQSAKFEIENLKQKNEELVETIKKNHDEKDQVFLRCIEAKDQLMETRTKINEKDMIIHQINLELRIAKEQAKMQEEQIANLKSQLCSLGPAPIKSLDFDLQVNNLKQEIMRLTLVNSELENEKKRILSEKEENINMLKKYHEETVEKLKNEKEFQSEVMIRDTEEAISRIQSDKEQIQAKLNFERRRSVRGLRNTIVMKDPFVASAEEIKRLKSQLSESLEENEKLSRDNQELLICWKESAIMLKELKRSMDTEAKRMQDIIKTRLVIEENN